MMVEEALFSKVVLAVPIVVKLIIAFNAERIPREHRADSGIDQVKMNQI